MTNVWNGGYTVTINKCVDDHDDLVDLIEIIELIESADVVQITRDDGMVVFDPNTIGVTMAEWIFGMYAPINRRHYIDGA